MKKESIHFNLMILCLIMVGVLQFFELPKALDYILGIIAIVLGMIGYIVKFRKE